MSRKVAASGSDNAKALKILYGAQQFQKEAQASEVHLVWVSAPECKAA